MFFPPTALGNLTGVTPKTLTSWSVGERQLLNHFLQAVSRVLVVVDNIFNPSLRVIVPMAFEKCCGAACACGAVGQPFAACDSGF